MSNKIKKPSVQIASKNKSKIYKSKSDPVEIRINRIVGQIEGVRKMYVKDKCNCVAIVQQISAVRAALARTSQVILLNETKRCADRGDIKKLKKIINETFHTV